MIRRPPRSTRSEFYSPTIFFFCATPLSHRTELIMSGPKKRRNVPPPKQVEDGSSSSEESMDDEEMSHDDDVSDEEMEEGQEIQVDFEGKTAEGGDFHGIKSLLNQLFLKAHINLSELADLLIEQSYVGSVLKQVIDEENEGSDDEGSENEVFGISSTINLTAKQDVECVKQLRAFIQEKSTNEKLKTVLSDPAEQVGFLLNERFINIPPQVSVPLLDNLKQEIQGAVADGKPFKFTKLVVIAKVHTPLAKGKNPSKTKQQNLINLLWVNAEEEFFTANATLCGEYSVQSESDTGLGGSWEEEDQEWEPKRRIYLMDFSGFDAAIEHVKNSL
uniref:Protein BCCIP homolog n=1 Tax=Lynceus sp. MCZ IZ 141354 TaxID=1930659 RepID=A0A9N6WUC7_9CRUS|nr:EOG090X0C3Y [Lynceus sp. MCZ IZ 141354]